VQRNPFDTLPNISALSFSPRNLTSFSRSETHQLGYHLPFKLNITLPIPIHIQIQRNRINRRLRDLNVGEDDGLGAKVDLCEVEGFEGTWEHGLEHGLDDVFDHLAASDLDVRPEVGYNAVEEACGVIGQYGIAHGDRT
jgi:hypothetical protein